MAAQKRTRNDAKESSPRKRQRHVAAPPRPTRNLTRNKTSQNEFAPKLSRTGKAAVDDDAGYSSDSSSLSDPPSTFASPTPPDSSKVKTVPESRKVAAKPVQKASAKEHEEALDLFVRDSSDEESDGSFGKEKIEGAHRTDEHSDEDDADGEWEDVDLSHRQELSLDRLHTGEESQDLEVILERTQQSMRLKYARFQSILISRNKAASAAERKVRMHTHLLHVQCLLVHGAIRNAWLEDEVLQVIIRSVSLLIS